MDEGPGAGAEDAARAEDRLPRLAGRRSLPAPPPPGHLSALAAPGVTMDASAVDAREPTVEILWAPRRIYVTLEISGAVPEEIEVRATSTHVRVRTPIADGRVYERDLDLLEPLEPGVVVTTYRNGVLDLTFRLRDAPKDDEEL